MRTALKILAFAALVGILAMAAAFFTDVLTLPRAQAGMLICTVAWFVSAPFWMEHKATD